MSTEERIKEIRERCEKAHSGCPYEEAEFLSRSKKDVPFLLGLIDNVSRITIMGTKLSHFGDMSALEALEKRPDIAVEMINGTFARADRHSSFEWEALREQIKKQSMALEIAKESLNIAFIEAEAHPKDVKFSVSKALTAIDEALK